MTYSAYIGLQAPIQRYFANAVTFGNPDNLSRGAGLTGAADTKFFTFSVWFKNSVTSIQQLYYSNGGLTEIFFNNPSSNVLLIRTTSSGGGTNLSVSYTNSAINDGAWHHVALSVDLNSSLTRYLYFDGVAVSPTWTTYSNSNIDHTTSNHIIGQGGAGANQLTMDIADLYINTGEYIDLSTNISKLINSDGKPNYIGDSGAAFTGTTPLIFLSGDTADWHTNKGTGGGFTENGTLTTATTSPSDA